MKKMIAIGISAIVAGGILLTLGNDSFQTYALLEKMLQEDDHICDADVCDTSYKSIPNSFFQTSLSYLFGGVALSGVGIWFLAKKRPSE
jgi:hypothetical protein